MSKRGALVVEAVFWWGACLGVWLLSLSAVSGEELLVATLSSLPCGVLAVVGRLAAGHSWRVHPRWLKPALLFPVAVVTDTVQVLASAVTGAGGHFVTRSVAGGRGEGAAAEGRRAAATFFATLTPGSVLIDIDPGTGEALVHVVAGRGPSMQDAATS